MRLGRTELAASVLLARLQPCIARQASRQFLPITPAGEPGTMRKLLDKLFKTTDPKEELGFCEEVGFVDAWNKLKKGHSADWFETCASLSTHACRSFTEHCEVRKFFNRVDQRRCTLNWKEDERVQIDAVSIRLRAALRWKKFKAHAAEKSYQALFLSLMAVGGLLQTTSDVIRFVGAFTGHVVGLVPLIGQPLKRVIGGRGARNGVFLHRGEKHGIFDYVADGVLQIMNAGRYVVFDPITSMEVSAEDMMSRKDDPVGLSMKWEHVMLPSIKFCQQMFNNAMVLSEETVRDLAKKLRESADSCRDRLTENVVGGRIGKVNKFNGQALSGLNDVCVDLCMALVDTLHHNIANLMLAAGMGSKPLDESCARYVVQPVEAEMLGCCADRCGWTGKFCKDWPFMSIASKKVWIAECCTEYQVVEKSERSRLCDSIGSKAEREAFHREDQKENPDGYLARTAGYTAAKRWRELFAPASSTDSLVQTQNDDCGEKFKDKNHCGKLNEDAVSECTNAGGWVPIKKDKTSGECESMYQTMERNNLHVSVEHPDECLEALEQEDLWAVEFHLEQVSVDTRKSYQASCYKHKRSDEFSDCYDCSDKRRLKDISERDKPESLEATAYVFLQ